MDATPVTRLLIKTLHELDEEIAEAEAKVAALTLERQGVEAVLKRFGETSTAVPVTTPPAAAKEAVSPNGRPQEPAGQVGQPTLTGRVLDLLHNSGRPMPIEDIAKSLDLDVTQARSATAYLKRKGEVHNVKRGLWQAGTPTDIAAKWDTDTETPAATGVSGTAPTSGPGGDDDQAQAQDHRHDLHGRNGVHLDRTPVGS